METVSSEYNHIINILLNGFGDNNGVRCTFVLVSCIIGSKLVKDTPILSPKPFNKIYLINYIMYIPT